MSGSYECVPNIGLKGRRRRTVMGIFWAGVTVSAFVWLAVSRASTAQFLIIAPLAAYASIFLFQAREKTWVFLAPRGLREEDDGKTRVRVAEEWVVAVRNQAKRVWMQTLVTTVIVTVVAVGFAILR